MPPKNGDGDKDLRLLLKVMMLGAALIFLFFFSFSYFSSPFFLSLSSFPCSLFEEREGGEWGVSGVCERVNGGVLIQLAWTSAACG